MTATNFTHQIHDWEATLLEFAHQLTGNQENAQELCNRTIEKALAREHQFINNGNLRNWLFTLMRSICASSYCKKARRKEPITIEQNKEPLMVGRAQEAVGYSSIMNNVQYFVDELNQEMKEPFLLHYYGYKYQEIADLLNLPLLLVKEQVTAAKRKLKLLQSKKSKDVLEKTA